MASSDDECDLDTLSALLEEDDSNDSKPERGNQSKETCAADSGKHTGGGTQEEDDEYDLDALSALLEDDDSLDSKPQCDGHLQANSCAADAKNDSHSEDEPQMESEDNYVADDIAAFFDKSDSESETDEFCEKKLVMDENMLDDSENNKDPDDNTEETSVSVQHKQSPPDFGLPAVSQDNAGVKTLQDELAMMQKRMMEIQQLIQSQSATGEATAATASPSSQPAQHSNKASRKQQVPSSQSSSSGPTERRKKPHQVQSKCQGNSGDSSGSKSRSSNSSSSAFVSSSSLTSSPPSSKTSDTCLNSSVKAAASNLHSPRTFSPHSSKGVLSPGSSGSNAVLGKKKAKSEQERMKSPLSETQSGAKNSSGVTRGSPCWQPKTSKGIQPQAAHARGDRREQNKPLNKFDGSADGGKCLPEDRKGLSEQTKVKSRPSSTFLSDVADREVGGSSRDREEGVDAGRTGMKRALFGDGDSDSDWDDMDGGGEKGSLSSAGHEIRKLLTHGERQRQAHTPSYAVPALTPLSKSWKAKPELATSQISSSLGQPGPSSTPANSSAIKKEPEDRDCMTEKFSGLRIRNPKISSIMLASKMEGRRMIPASKLHLKVKSADLQGDWVTIGVIVHKSDSRKSQTGKTYSIWKLSDLQDTDTTVSFFLFGQVYKQLWKMSVGTVIGLLNPSIMDAMEKKPDEVAFTVNNAAQLMDVGHSRDLGWCIGKTKQGNTCTRFINKKCGDFCTYHVQAAYRKQSAKRSELHGSCPGTAPKSSLKSKLLQNNTFFYGGETFSSAKGKGGGGKNDKVTLAKLQCQATQQDKRKVSTLSIQDLIPADRAAVETKLVSKNDQTFLDLLSTPSTGSMNLVHHIAKSGQKQGVTASALKNVKGSAGFQSVQAGDLLKQHRQQMAERLSQRRQGSTATSHRQLQSPRQLGASPASTKQAAAPFKRTSPGDKGGSGTGVALSSPPEKQGGDKGHPPKAPVIGKGFYPGSKIDLFSASPRTGSAAAAKLKAIQKVQAQGGLSKTDPNAIHNPTPDPEKIRKRVLQDIENDSSKGEASHAGSGGDAEPAKKRSRLLGNVDLDSDEVKQLLNAKSSHTGALAQAEAEREERYFDNLEKKEAMEEKMKSVTSMEVTAFTCAQCKYTAQAVGELCKREKHNVKKHKAKRRYFACKKCKHRTVSLQRYPTVPCTKCGEHNFEKTSMHKEKSGPKLESETLCLRGDESKFINAMDQKVYVATFEQE